MQPITSIWKQRSLEAGNLHCIITSIWKRNWKLKFLCLFFNVNFIAEKNLNLLKIRSNIECVPIHYLHMEGNVNYVKYSLPPYGR